MIMLPIRLQRAINYAAIAHGTQERKSLHVPYIIHPTTVALILRGFEFSTDTCIAGALHDVLEDTNVTYAQLKREFGEDIAIDVKALSEPDKSLPWEERKKIAMKHIATMSKSQLAIKSADAISNMTDMIACHEVKGDRMFKAFKRGKSDQILRYIALTKAIMERKQCWSFDEAEREIFQELEATKEMLINIF